MNLPISHKKKFLNLLTEDYWDKVNLGYSLIYLSFVVILSVFAVVYTGRTEFLFFAGFVLLVFWFWVFFGFVAFQVLRHKKGWSRTLKTQFAIVASFFIPIIIIYILLVLTTEIYDF